MSSIGVVYYYIILLLYIEGIFSHWILKWHLTHCAAMPYRPFVYAVVVARIMMVRPHLFISQKLTNKIMKKQQQPNSIKWLIAKTAGCKIYTFRPAAIATNTAGETSRRKNNQHGNKRSWPRESSIQANQLYSTLQPRF